MAIRPGRRRQQRDKPADITSLYVRSNSGALIQLDNLVDMTENSSPPTLYHYNRYKSATISATLAQGRTLGEGIEEMRWIAKKVLTPPFIPTGRVRPGTLRKAARNTSFALVLALLVYLFDFGRAL